MKILLILKMAYYNVATKKLRATLTIGGIAISVALLIVLMGIGSGLQSLVTEQLTESESQNVVTVSAKTQQLQLDQGAISEITSISGVSETEEIAGLSGQAEFNNSTINLPVYAVSDGYVDLVSLSLSHGEAFDSTDEPTMLVSQAALKALGSEEYENSIGRTINASVAISKDFAPDQEEEIRSTEPTEYKIKGIIANSTDPIIYVKLEPFRQEMVSVVSQLKLRVAFKDKIDSVRESVEQLGFQTSSIIDSIEQVENIFNLIRNILVYFGLITILVATFSTLNTITIALIEQTPQISFLRIMGISKHEVGIMFIVESLLIAMSGAFGGIILGLIIGFFANGVVAGAANDLLGGGNIYIFKPPIFFIVFLIVAGFGIGWAIGTIPARRAVKIRPLVGAEQ